MGGSESVAAKSVSTSVQVLADAAFDFAIDEAHNGLCLVKLGPEDALPQYFDAIYVIAIPLEKSKLSAITDRLMHSVVILVQQVTGIGHMLEYTNNHKVMMSEAGRLAKRTGLIASHRPYRNFREGFQSCSISLQRLLRFNKRFQNLSDYHAVFHNCHIYHRSLVATAINNRCLYNHCNQSRAFYKGMSGSKKWYELSSAASCRRDLLQGSNKTTYSLKKWLGERSTVCSVQAVIYDLDSHHVISAAGMRLSMEDMMKLLETRSPTNAREDADSSPRTVAEAEAEVEVDEEVDSQSESDSDEGERVSVERAERMERETLQLSELAVMISFLLTFTVML